MASQHTIHAGFFAVCLFLALGWRGAGCEAPDSGVTAAAATLDPSKIDGALLERPSQDVLADIIEAFYRSALGREVTHVEAVSESEKNERIPFPEQYFRVREESSGRVSTVQLYLPSGTIASYGLEEPFFEDREHEELITKAEAFEAAKPILKWYDQPLNISDYYIGEDRMERPFRYWSIRRQASYEGIPIRARWSDILVYNRSAEVAWVFMYPPIVPPERRAISVEKAEALQKAMAWFEALKDIKKQGLRYEFNTDLDRMERDITPILNIPFDYVEQPEKKDICPIDCTMLGVFRSA